jgi:hypothetical protein
MLALFGHFYVTNYKKPVPSAKKAASEDASVLKKEE